MAIKPVNTTPHTESQRRYQQFWKQFNEYSAKDEKFCAEFKTHPYADVRYYQDYAVSTGPYHLCFGINFKRQECNVEAYFRDLDAWDIYFNNYKESIESQIGHSLVWKKLGTKGAASLIRKMDFDESKGWDNVYKQAIVDLLLLKRVFGQFYSKAKRRQNRLFSNLDYEEITNPDELIEGAKKTLIVNQYERNPEARRQCIKARGCYCHVCGLDFAEKYGEIGEGFIHVHHLVPLSSIGKDYVVDPIKDLIPVCPNCHAMLHRTVSGHLMSIEELQSALLSKTEYFDGRSDTHD